MPHCPDPKLVQLSRAEPTGVSAAGITLLHLLGGHGVSHLEVRRYSSLDEPQVELAAGVHQGDFCQNGVEFPARGHSESQGSKTSSAGTPAHPVKCSLFCSEINAARFHPCCQAAKLSRVTATCKQRQSCLEGYLGSSFTWRAAPSLDSSPLCAELNGTSCAGKQLNATRMDWLSSSPVRHPMANQASSSCFTAGSCSSSSNSLLCAQPRDLHL